MHYINLLKNLSKAFINYINNRPINSVTEIKITNLCNQRCKQCNIYEIRSKHPHLTYRNFKKIAKNLENYGSLVGMISGGEPILNPELPEILLLSKEIFPLSTSLVSGLYFPYKQISNIIDFCLKENINIQTSLDGVNKKADFLRGVKDHAKVVINNMKIIAKQKEKMDSNSFLYANCVLNAINLEQIPDIIRVCKEAGWKTTIGFYHNLLKTTKYDKELKITNHKKFNQILDFLVGNKDILNLDTFIKELPRVINKDYPAFCPFVDGKRTSTRLTIYKNGDLNLCYGGSIGNIIVTPLKEIFQKNRYFNMLNKYKTCEGCWSSCYTQKHLLFHPQNLSQAIHNVRKLLNLTPAIKGNN